MSYIEKELSWIDETNENEISAEKFLADTFNSDNNCFIAGEYAIFASRLTFQIAFIEMKEHLNIKLEESKIPYGDLYTMFTEKIPMLSLDEVKNLAEKFVNDFIEENGGHYLRIWDQTSNQGIFNDEALTSKYYKLVPILQKWFNNWLKENLNVKYKVEAYLIGNEIQKKIEEYSFSMKYTQSECEQLWGVLRTIHHSFYNKKLIASLNDTIKELTSWCCPKDYWECDFENKEVLYNLFIELSEILHKEDAYKGHELFNRYDGYGNVVSEIDNTIRGDYYYEIELDDE